MASEIPDTDGKAVCLTDTDRANIWRNYDLAMTRLHERGGASLVHGESSAQIRGTITQILVLACQAFKGDTRATSEVLKDAADYGIQPWDEDGFTQQEHQRFMSLLAFVSGEER